MPREDAATPPPQDGEHSALSGLENSDLFVFLLSVPGNPTSRWEPGWTPRGPGGVGHSVDKSWVLKGP